MKKKTNRTNRSRLQADITNPQTHQRDRLHDLDRRICEIAGANARTVFAGDLLIPNEAITLKNLNELFELDGWGPRLRDDRIIIDVGVAADVKDDDLSAFVVRYPGYLVVFMNWYMRPEKSLEEKLRFINQLNIKLSAVSVAYMGMPMGNETVFTPHPGVVSACFQLSALHGLSFNQITMGIHILVR